MIDQLQVQGETDMAGLNEYTPFISPSAYIHPSAVIIGNVRIGRNVFIGPNAVIRADEADGDSVVSPVIIEDEVNIQDNVVIHALEGSVARIGKGSSISHSAVVHGPCEIGRECFIGFNSVVFMSTIGDGTVVMHQAVVENAVIPEKRSVPSGSIVKNDADAAGLGPVTEELSAFASKVRKNNLKLPGSPVYKPEATLNKAVVNKKDSFPQIAVVTGR